MYLSARYDIILDRFFIKGLIDDNYNKLSLYYQFNIDVSELIDGEYTLYLFTEDGELITTELVQIGDYVNKHNTTYNKNNKYVTYNG